MATNNLFLGTARRSVGDITLYRRDGVQVARARVRNIANPKTTGQATQRAFFAPVARFYSPFATVLETSFEGLNKTRSYSQFLKDNIALARTQGWYLPKGANFAPLPYKLSRGSVAPLSTTFEAETDNFVIFLPGISDITTVGQLSQAFMKAGYREGDQVTIIAVLKLNSGDYLPDWLRFNLSASSAATIASLWAGHQFQLMVAQNGLHIAETEYLVAAAAAIVSRFENGVWRRSTQYLVLADDELEALVSPEARAAAIASYGPASTLTTSDVYLNGTDNFVIAKTDTPLIPEVTVVSLQTYSRSGSTPVYVGVDNKGMGRPIKDNRVDSAHFNKILAANNTWVEDDTAMVQGTLVIDHDSQAFINWLVSRGVPSTVF